MMANVVVSEPSLREQRITFALLPLPAVAALVLGTITAPSPWLSLALFVVTVFGSVAAQRFGPRGTALRLLAFNAFFFALFFQARAADLPELVAATVIGLAVAFVVHFVLVPQRAHRTARRVLRALPAMVSLALGALAGSLAASEAARTLRLRRELQRLNEGTLALDDHLARASDDDLGGAKASLRRCAFELEIELEIAAGRWRPAPSRSPATRTRP